MTDYSFTVLRGSNYAFFFLNFTVRLQFYLRPVGTTSAVVFHKGTIPSIIILRYLEIHDLSFLFPLGSPTHISLQSCISGSFLASGFIMVPCSYYLYIDFLLVSYNNV
ncbi:hypothetical protein BYT27DRAFT_6687295 [Phlegmacium glaucopus]|nr:hypothetical protein BYT27DRAFT_6687295 [Phlegmacium glaucopus]